MLDRLIIFCRYPVPGKTKTRLIQTLGPFRAADLHRKLAEATFEMVKNFASEYPVDVESSFEGGSKTQIRRWLGPLPKVSFQKPGDLGQRMHNAFQGAFRMGCKKVVLIGTDVPEASEEHLSQAFEALDNYEMVLGPTYDGGYWLIGLTGPFEVFDNIRWGSDTVLDETMSLARRVGLSSTLLDPLNDIDTVNDLIRMLPGEAHPGPYISVVIPVINEEENIGKTIAHAHDENSEIILVDGGSSDNTMAIAAESGARVISGHRGRSFQQNAGAEVSQGKVLLFLHADTLLPDDYAADIFEALMDHDVAAGAFRFATDLEVPIMRMIEFAVNMRSKYLHLPYGDQGIFTRKETFHSVGGFPDVSLAEDLFLVRSMSRFGKICIVPSTVMTSGRRWKKLGIFRTTLINIIILAGCLAGVKPERLAWLYHRN
jgi:rSAM/selenodomain-associated transferase 2/rSAM/selenodomain-associated transferase 1